MSDLKQLQQIELKLANKFVQICEANQLRYYMIGGTFLGAIRHKGFIPWDDDMDFGMPRTDYEKFMHLTMAEHNLQIQHYSISMKDKYSFMKLVDQKVQIQIHNGKEIQVVPSWIDIFPLDNVPQNRLVKRLYLLHLLMIRMLISFKNIDRLDTKRKRPFYEKVLVGIALHTPIAKLYSLKTLYRKLDRVLSKYPENKGYYWLNVMGSYKAKEIFPVTVFGEGKKYAFEDKLFVGPDNADAYLSHLYGNYHQIPDENHRNHHHSKVLS